MMMIILQVIMLILWLVNLFFIISSYYYYSNIDKPGYLCAIKPLNEQTGIESNRGHILLALTIGASKKMCPRLCPRF